jgi:methanogenic corrinoid protein MtbC1
MAAHTALGASRHGATKPMKLDEHYGAYLASLLRGDHATCARVVHQALAEGVAIAELYSDLFRASLYEVGELWQSNRISVATEHLATAITESVMSQVVGPALFGHEPIGRTLIVACVTNEYHQVGGRMVADLAELQGWDTYFLGANTPLPDLLDLLADKRPDLLALSVAFYANFPTLQGGIEAVRRRHPDLPIWLGGQMFRWGGQELAQAYPNLRLFQSLDDYQTGLQHFAGAAVRN